ncbi:MAG: hypothetical protein WED04_06010 [Promethearchaeati archaeon SRVP18_Atabeyarchaeia-1]
MEADFSSKFVVVSLRLGRHVDGLVDSYFGPQELAELVDKEHLKPMGEILFELEELRKQVASEPIDEMRKTFLLKQIRAIHAHARVQMGLRMSYREFVSSTLDIEPKDVKQQEISELRGELESLLRRKGYQGSLAEMLLEFEKKRLISGERLKAIFYNLVAEAREHTRRVFQLPPGEEVEFDRLVNRPYSSDNKYLGNYKSLFRLNVDYPLISASLPIHVTHQTYPGHHTEHVLKELELYRGKNQRESCIMLSNTPESTISEGLADTSTKFILGEPSMAEDKIQALEMTFRRSIRANAALMVHDKHLGVEDARKYMLDEGAYDRNESELGMRWLLDPFWRAYLFTYYEGGNLVSEAWRRAKEAGKEQQLLDILYREQNCPTTFMVKMKRLLA